VCVCVCVCKQGNANNNCITIKQYNSNDTDCSKIVVYMNLFPNLKKKILLYHRYILNQWVTSSSDWRALPQGVLSRSSAYWNGPSTRRPIGWSFLSNPFIMILTTIKESWRKFGDSLKVNVSLYVGFLLLGTTELFLDFTFWPHEKYTTLTYVLYLSVTINAKKKIVYNKSLDFL